MTVGVGANDDHLSNSNNNNINNNNGNMLSFSWKSASWKKIHPHALVFEPSLRIDAEVSAFLKLKEIGHHGISIRISAERLQE